MRQKDVAEAFGITSQAVSQWEASRTRPDSQRLTNLARLFDVRLEWLLDESGPMSYEGDAASAEAIPITHIPVIDPVLAGDWTSAEPSLATHSSSNFLQTDLVVSPDSFALTVSGRSMEPEFQPGDKIIIDPGVEPRPGDFVVAKREKDREAIFMKYRPRSQGETDRAVIELAPLNPDWPTLMIDRDNPGRVVGTMVEHRRYRKE